jgi:hypothetical protein
VGDLLPVHLIDAGRSVCSSAHGDDLVQVRLRDLNSFAKRRLLRHPRLRFYNDFERRYPRVHSFFSLPGGRVRRPFLEWLTRYVQPGFRRGNNRISQVPGEPQVSVRHVQSTPAGLLAPDHYGVAARPLVSEQQRLPRKVFRRSIEWPSDSLSTLRCAGHPRPTQVSLPAVGQTLLDGLSTRRVPTKGFRAVSYILSPFPKLLAAIGSTDASEKQLRRSMLFHTPATFGS